MSDPQPSAERHQHDNINREIETLADSNGSIGLPWRVESMLERLERNRDIGVAERQAGEEFQRLFNLAHLDPLRAADIVRGERSTGGREPHASDRARRQISAALDALGGHASPGGSCAWHVLGCEITLNAWAKREGWNGRRLNQATAKGVLIGALGALVAHFGL